MYLNKEEKGMSNAKDIKINKFPITINGKDRNLVFDMNAFIEIEDQYGDIDKCMEAVEKGSIKALRLLLWAGLIHDDPTLTPQAVGQMIDMGGIQEMSQIIFAGMMPNMPQPTTPVENKALNVEAIDPNARKQVPEV